MSWCRLDLLEWVTRPPPVYSLVTLIITKSSTLKEEKCEDITLKSTSCHIKIIEDLSVHKDIAFWVAVKYSYSIDNLNRDTTTSQDGKQEFSVYGIECFPKINGGGYKRVVFDGKFFHDTSENVYLLRPASAWSKSCLVTSKLGVNSCMDSI